MIRHHHHHHHHHHDDDHVHGDDECAELLGKNGGGAHSLGGEDGGRWMGPISFAPLPPFCAPFFVGRIIMSFARSSSTLYLTYVTTAFSFLQTMEGPFFTFPLFPFADRSRLSPHGSFRSERNNRVSRAHDGNKEEDRILSLFYSQGDAARNASPRLSK